MNYWLIAALVLSLVSPIFYTKSMLAGKAKPHRVTRLVIWLASVATLLGVLHSTNTAGMVFAAIFLARATYLLGMSVLYGVGGASRLDRSCLAIGALAVALYGLTGNGLMAVLLGICADVIGFVPTFVKTWHMPESEDPTFFAVEGTAALAGVFAVGQLRVDVILPVYIVLCNIVMLIFIHRKQLVRRAKRLSTSSTEIPF